MSVLTIAQAVADDVALTRPVSLFAAYDEGDTGDLKLRRALHKTCAFLNAYYDWNVLRAEHTFTSQANGIQSGAKPSDFLRFVRGSMFDRTNQARVIGPVDASEWQRRSAIQVVLGPPIYTIRGRDLLLRSQHAIGATIAYEYVRNSLGTTADGTTRKAVFTADTDLPYWDDELVHLGMVWSVMHRDGNTNNEDYAAFLTGLHDRIGHEGGADVLDMAGGGDVADNHPETFAGLA